MARESRDGAGASSRALPELLGELRQPCPQLGGAGSLFPDTFAERWERPLGSTVFDFRRWSSSDLVSNATRGRTAEFLVALNALRATPRTEAAWVERARQRTIKHLREEVAAALTALRLSGEADCPPPAEPELAAFHELEQAVVSGRACQAQSTTGPDVARAVADARGVITDLAEPASAERRAWLEMLGSLARWLDSGLQLSAAQLSAAERKARQSGAGRIELRLRMSRATSAWWRGLEAQARRWLPCGMSWLRFLCLSLWQAWRHLLGADVAYGQIYIRDRFRCSSPVCSRRDVTPHHLQFRSAGGSDEDDNVAAVCSWCHLEGVHGGRIRARGTARDIRWELGARGNPCLVVQGRERVAA